MSQPVVHYVTPAVRIFLGLLFVVFGLNGFFGFLPAPPHSGEAGHFIGALVRTGYLLQVVKGLEVAMGLLLLANRFVPAALAVLAPIVFNIVAFHFLLAPPNAVTFVVLIAHGWLMWSHRASFAPLFGRGESISSGPSRAGATTAAS